MSKLKVSDKPSSRKKVGAIANELKEKEAPTKDPVELQREMQKDYEKNLIETVEAGKKQWEGNFYIVVITKRERLLDNVLRNYFFHRVTCPSPDWDQAVYLYEKDKERIIFLWVLPSKEACEHLTRYAKEVVPQERQLLDFVLRLNDGSLEAFAKRMNGEKADSPLLDK